MNNYYKRNTTDSSDYAYDESPTTEDSDNESPDSIAVNYDTSDDDQEYSQEYRRNKLATLRRGEYHRLLPTEKIKRINRKQSNSRTCSKFRNIPVVQKKFQASKRVCTFDHSIPSKKKKQKTRQESSRYGHSSRAQFQFQDHQEIDPHEIVSFKQVRNMLTDCGGCAFTDDTSQDERPYVRPDRNEIALNRYWNEKKLKSRREKNIRKMKRLRHAKRSSQSARRVSWEDQCYTPQRYFTDGASRSHLVDEEQEDFDENLEEVFNDRIPQESRSTPVAAPNLQLGNHAPEAVEDCRTDQFATQFVHSDTPAVRCYFNKGLNEPENNYVFEDITLDEVNQIERISLPDDEIQETKQIPARNLLPEPDEVSVKIEEPTFQTEEFDELPLDLSMKPKNSFNLISSVHLTPGTASTTDRNVGDIYNSGGNIFDPIGSSTSFTVQERLPTISAIAGIEDSFEPAFRTSTMEYRIESTGDSYRITNDSKDIPQSKFIQIEEMSKYYIDANTGGESISLEGINDNLAFSPRLVMKMPLPNRGYKKYSDLEEKFVGGSSEIPPSDGSEFIKTPEHLNLKKNMIVTEGARTSPAKESMQFNESTKYETSLPENQPAEIPKPKGKQKSAKPKKVPPIKTKDFSKLTKTHVPKPKPGNKMAKSRKKQLGASYENGVPTVTRLLPPKSPMLVCTDRPILEQLYEEGQQSRGVEELLREAGVKTYVSCDNCNKTRYLPDVFDPTLLEDKWYCTDRLDLLKNGCDEPEAEIEEEDKKNWIYSQYNIGSMVWAKLKGYPWWPAMVDEDPDTKYSAWPDNDFIYATHYHVTFLDNDHLTRGWIQPNNIKSYRKHKMKQNLSKYKPFVKERFKLALKNARRAANLDIDSRLKEYSFLSDQYRRNRAKAASTDGGLQFSNLPQSSCLSK